MPKPKISLPLLPTILTPSAASACPPIIIPASNLTIIHETPLGAGASATVFRGALHSSPVAVKVCTATPRAEAQLSREVRRLHAARHPNIVAVYGVSPRVAAPSRPANLALVTELCAGGSLHAACEELRQRRRRLRPVDAALVAGNVSSALAYLHEVVGVSQGDLKGLNILLTMPIGPDGRLPKGCSAKVCDFGLSRRLKGVGVQKAVSPTVPVRRGRKLASAAEGGVEGTMPYLAPEAFDAKALERPEVAKAADVFALGVVLYEMFSGRSAWEGVREWGVYVNVVRKGLRPTWPDDVTDVGEWRALVERCWAQEPTERPSAREVCDEVERISAGMVASEEEGDECDESATREIDDEEDEGVVRSWELPELPPGDFGSEHQHASAASSEWTDEEGSWSGSSEGDRRGIYDSVDCLLEGIEEDLNALNGSLSRPLPSADSSPFCSYSSGGSLGRQLDRELAEDRRSRSLHDRFDSLAGPVDGFFGVRQIAESTHLTRSMTEDALFGGNVHRVQTDDRRALAKLPVPSNESLATSLHKTDRSSALIGEQTRNSRSSPVVAGEVSDSVQAVEKAIAKLQQGEDASAHLGHHRQPPKLPVTPPLLKNEIEIARQGQSGVPSYLKARVQSSDMEKGTRKGQQRAAPETAVDDRVLDELEKELAGDFFDDCFKY